MVSYQKWTQIAFKTAKNLGMASSQETSQQLISVAADVWNDRKGELSAATVAEAEDIARQEIHIQGTL